MIWFTADFHAGHANILRFCDRPFSTVQEMDAAIIERHNWLVGPGDTCYILGDFTLGGPEIAANYFRQLHGHLKVLPGDHDKRWLRGKNFYSIDARVEILPPIHVLEIPVEGSKWPQTIVLCHWCLRTWPRSHFNSAHAFAHSHGRLPPIGKSWDVGVDNNDFWPVSLDQFNGIMMSRPDNPNLVERLRSAAE